jgi:hypothetical protein
MLEIGRKFETLSLTSSRDLEEGRLLQSVLGRQSYSEHYPTSTKHHCK